MDSLFLNLFYQENQEIPYIIDICNYETGEVVQYFNYVPIGDGMRLASEWINQSSYSLKEIEDDSLGRITIWVTE